MNFINLTYNFFAIDFFTIGGFIVKIGNQEILFCGIHFNEPFILKINEELIKPGQMTEKKLKIIVIIHSYC